MILRTSTVFGFLALVLPFVTAGPRARRHQEVAHRARGDVDIHKRQSFTNARFTWYDVGLGACGINNVPGDWIVALTTQQFGGGFPGPHCFQMVTIQYGGKTAQAQITDECMGCPYGGLDFSKGLFDYFASESAGVLYGTWWFGGDSGGGGGGGQTTSAWTPPSTTWEPPAPTSTSVYIPPAPQTSSTPEYTPPPTTSSTPAYTPPPATTTTSTTSTTSITSFNSSTYSTSSSIDLNSSLISGLAVSTGGLVSPPSTSDPQNLLVFNDIVLSAGGLLLVAS